MRAHTFAHAPPQCLRRASASEVSSPHDYVPIAIQTFLALGFVFGGLAFAAWLGPKKNGKVKNDNFECGIEQYGNARSPFSIKYFLIAILFVLFDVEIIFLYPWAVNFKALGLLGFVEVVLFIFFVLAGFFYVIKKGALKWE
jgi:NADH-quinone oxidoreductase subunit A